MKFTEDKFEHAVIEPFESTVSALYENNNKIYKLIADGFVFKRVILDRL